jgi:4-hydroxybenzoyl-CoA reductase subunit alpha
MGQALTEQILRDQGSMLTSSFLTYAMPTSVDMPPEIKSAMVGEPDPAGPFGAKESGESLQCSTLPAIANAIFHAVGVRITDLPITPEKVLAALEEKRAQEGGKAPSI